MLYYVQNKNFSLGFFCDCFSLLLPYPERNLPGGPHY